MAASVGTGVALGVSVAEAVLEGREEAVVLADVSIALGLDDGCAGCGLQPANTTKIESPMRIRSRVFILGLVFRLFGSGRAIRVEAGFWMEGKGLDYRVKQCLSLCVHI